MRLALLKAYVGAVVRKQANGSRDVIVLPAGFQHDSTLRKHKEEFERHLDEFRGRSVLISTGVDDDADAQFSLLADLSGNAIRWVVTAQKFMRSDDSSPRGDREAQRSAVWRNLQVFSLCCRDGCALRGGVPPKSFSWDSSVPFHLVMNNSHYHGSPNKLFSVWQAGRIGGGMAMLVGKRGQVRTKGGKGLACMAFFTSRAPSAGRWRYYTSSTAPGVEDTVDIRDGRGAIAAWSRIIRLP